MGARSPPAVSDASIRRELRGIRRGTALAEFANVWCRIQLRHESGRLVVQLAGHLSEAQVPELLASCAQATKPIVELDELVSADAVGLDALQRIEQQGAELVGLLEYLRFELDTLRRERT